ncbi:hypothetical protein SCHPADRAFT_483805 [Schizopora paradoxa]|uniref:Uncharacterized protein n=1 Tax=Schizopora paradoxa TaxID=27342 RepID=A0A0H2RHT0_9AGAM|nr:hypothetical protein SCHPADRAFT_483805 [Schizopora paradoxa]
MSRSGSTVVHMYPYGTRSTIVGVTLSKQQIKGVPLVAGEESRCRCQLYRCSRDRYPLTSKKRESARCGPVALPAGIWKPEGDSLLCRSTSCARTCIGISIQRCKAAPPSSGSHWLKGYDNPAEGVSQLSQSAILDIRVGALRYSAVKHRRLMSPAERTTSGSKSARRGAGTVTAASGSRRVRKVSLFSDFLFVDAAVILIAFVAYKIARQRSGDSSETSPSSQ